MPVAYTIDQSRSIVLTRGWGVAVDRDLHAHVRSLAADSRFRPHFKQFGDLRGVVKADITRLGIRQLSDLNPFGAGAKRAVVVGSDVVYGMARMYQVMRADRGDELEVFRDADLAFEWLGVPAADRGGLLALLAQAPPIPVPE
ncbi:MAG: hypothetical protein ACHQU8_09140 [Gemmatimonadales bacterium]